MNKLQAELEEKDYTLKTLKKEAYHFQNFILSQDSSQTKVQIEPFLLIKYKEKQINEKELMIEKLKKKKIHLNNKIKKYQLKDEKIDTDQEDLKFIDFH